MLRLLPLERASMEGRNRRQKLPFNALAVIRECNLFPDDVKVNG